MRPKQWSTLSDGSPLTRQESFVLRQVAAGEIADLKKEFGEAEEERRIRARFLEELLTGELQGVEIHRRGVLIENAVIEEPMQLQTTEVTVPVEFSACIFKGDVSFKDACLKKPASFSGSHFLKAAEFHRMKGESIFFCQNAVFKGPVDFAAATIAGHFAAEKAKFLAKDQKANFNGMQVGKDAFFDGAEFHGAVDFVGAAIKGEFGAAGAKFLAESQPVNFNGIQVSHEAFFEGAEFYGPATFVGATIKGQLVAHRAKFLAPNHKIDFHRMQVGQDAFFQGCDFHGLVSFVQIKISGDFHLEPLQKTGPSLATIFRSGVNFHGADIGGELLADKAQFLGHIVNFEAVKVGRSFHASGIIFAGSVYFTEMEVKNNFYIDPFGKIKSFKTLFKGPANFSRVAVGGVFNAEHAIFQGEDVIFTGIKVGQAALFNGTIFFGGFVLKDGQVTDLELSGLHKLSAGGLPLEEITLNRTRVEHRLTLENLEVKRFYARNLEVKGPAELRRLAIRDEADLRDASFHHLQMVDIHWPRSDDPQKKEKKIFLDGFTFQSLTTRAAAEAAEKWPELLAWLGWSRFNTETYGQLDAYFQRSGLRKWADRVYIEGKRRELGVKKWWHPANWLTRFFWGLLAGFGRKPGRTFWPALALVLLGWLVFQPVCLEPQHWLAGFQQGHPYWTGLMVSLDRFLPGVDLGVAKICRPGDLSPFLWFYWHFQKIMGWILAPIVLAAIYTRIK